MEDTRYMRKRPIDYKALNSCAYDSPTRAFRAGRSILDVCLRSIKPTNPLFFLLPVTVAIDHGGCVDTNGKQVNEAFAAQYLAVEKELGLDRSKTNVNGGAIALGHPLGASGSRITTHLAHELRRSGKKYGVGAACIGGGQGIAIVLESMQ